MSKPDNNNEGLDFIGIGKVVKSIPPEVFTQSTNTIIETFNKITAPITETTSGFGRYIRQKFDNMVETEKALATYAIQRALAKADEKAAKTGDRIIPPSHIKSFVKSVEEASKEMDSSLHEMWSGLLSEQLVNPNFHPHFVEMLQHFSPSEARLLVSLRKYEKIGKHVGNYVSYSDDSFRYWKRSSQDKILKKWDYSCDLLIDFKFADIAEPKTSRVKGLLGPGRVAILYRTKAGDAFLSAVRS